MKLYNKDTNKGKFQSFVNFTKKINDIGFSRFTFSKKVPQDIFLTFIISNLIKLESILIACAKI